MKCVPATPVCVKKLEVRKLKLRVTAEETKVLYSERAPSSPLRKGSEANNGTDT